jgi:hypothetical protein
MATHYVWKIVIATVVGGGTLFVSEKFWTTTNPENLITQAEARIGRPLTPFSIAGVARRTTRRAVVAGAIAGGAIAYGYGSGYGYGYPYGYGSSYAYGYPYSYGGYSSYGYASSYPYYGASYGYYRPLGWRLGWW